MVDVNHMLFILTLTGVAMVLVGSVLHFLRLRKHPQPLARLTRVAKRKDSNGATACTYFLDYCPDSRHQGEKLLFRVLHILGSDHPTFEPIASKLEVHLHYPQNAVEEEKLRRIFMELIGVPERWYSCAPVEMMAIPPGYGLLVDYAHDVATFMVPDQDRDPYATYVVGRSIVAKLSANDDGVAQVHFIRERDVSSHLPDYWCNAAMEVGTYISEIDALNRLMQDYLDTFFLSNVSYHLIEIGAIGAALQDSDQSPTVHCVNPSVYQSLLDEMVFLDQLVTIAVEGSSKYFLGARALRIQYPTKTYRVVGIYADYDNMDRPLRYKRFDLYDDDGDPSILPTDEASAIRYLLDNLEVVTTRDPITGVYRIRKDSVVSAILREMPKEF